MSESILLLSRPAREGLTLIHGAGGVVQSADPIWRLLLTALFAAFAALTCAAVVIFGAPGADPGLSQGDAVHMRLALH